MSAETDIAAIDDGGANTAAEVRTALTAVLGRADGAAEIKSSGTSRSSTTTAAADPDLVVALEASSSYIIEALFIVEGATFKVGLTGPSGAAMAWSTWGQPNTASTTTGDIDQSARVASGGTNNRAAFADPNFLGHLLRGSIITTTAGNLTVIWAQAVSSGTATVLRAGSWLRATKVA